MPESASSATRVANASDPADPFAQCFARIASAPCSVQNACTAAISASVSLMKWLMATTTGTPNDFRFSICRPRLGQPAITASTFSSLSASLVTPPFIFMARTVATKTTAAGAIPALRHLMLKNFSAPRSAPNPASVTT